MNGRAIARGRLPPDEACALFGELRRNGTALAGLIEADAAWCALPDGYAAQVRTNLSETEAVGRRVCARIRPTPVRTDPLPDHAGG